MIIDKDTMSVSNKEIKKANLEKMISEFLSIIDFKLCSIDEDSITIQDIKNMDELNQVIALPIDFTSADNLRVFKSSKLDNDDYYISILNTKYRKVPFSKNGIDGFNMSIRRNSPFSKDDDLFSSEIFYNGSLYITFIGRSSEQNYSSYRKCNNLGEFIDIIYNLDEKDRTLEISSHISPMANRKIYISENISNHHATLVVKENEQEVYKQEIKDNEVEDYFKALAYKGKNIVEQANNGIRTLNNNIFEIIFDYYDIATEFLNIINDITSSNKIIDELFEKYFGNSSLNNDSKSNKNAKKLVDNIDKMKSPHKSEISCSERFGTIEDYTQYQEQKDLNNYKTFINSSAYDDIKEAESEISHQKKLTLKDLRKTSAQHEE